MVLHRPGRDLAAYAARRTAGETFSLADWDLMMAGVAENTRKTARRAWLRVLRFCGEHGYSECPMPIETCVKLVNAQWQHPGRYGRPTSPETVKLILWAVTKAHKVARRPDGTVGYVSPVGSEEVQRALRGYTNRWVKAGHRPDKASPIEPDELIRMVATCDARSPAGLRDAFAFALGYDMGARVSEAAGLLFRDLEIHVADPDNITTADHFVVHVPYSKTDQEGDGDEVFIYAHPAAAASTCAVRLGLAWMAMLRDRGLSLDGPVLRRVLGGGTRPADGRPKAGTISTQGLSFAALESMFVRAVEAAGLENPEGRRRHFVWQGFRAGSAEASAGAGADTPELNRHYRWSQRGTTAQRYAARGRKRRHNPAKRIWSERTVGGN